MCFDACRSGPWPRLVLLAAPIALIDHAYKVLRLTSTLATYFYAVVTYAAGIHIDGVIR